jgi:putative phosphoribosyl transferase
MSRSILGNELSKITIQDANDYFSEQCIFKNRIDAAKRLADKLKLLIDGRPSEFIILAIPRGGVVTGDVIASSIGAKLDIVVSRKIGAPYNPEVAIGAVMHDGSFFPNEDIINISNISQE